MWRTSQTLPRHRPTEAPPPPPHGAERSGTLLRIDTKDRIDHHSRRSAIDTKKPVDVDQLRNDIDMLSQQLSMVKAQLDKRFSEQRQQTIPSRRLARSHDSLDSRLSTILFSPSPKNSTHNTPTPQPTQLNVNIGNSYELDWKPVRKNEDSHDNAPITLTGVSTTHDYQNFTSVPRSNTASGISKRMSINIPSSSIVMPRVKRKETFSKADKVGNTIKQKSQRRITRAESMPLPPQKPQRTFAESFGSRTQKSQLDLPRFRDSKSHSYSNGSIAEILAQDDFMESMKENYKNGHCWFSFDKELYFVNPFNDISSSKHISYNAVNGITSSLLESRNTALILRGISGSGKSQLAEMICLDLIDRLDQRGAASAILYAAMLALKPFLTTNSRPNNQASRAVQHFEIHVRDSRLHRVCLRHYLIDSPSRGCRANIFAMIANDMHEEEKDVYRISGFRLRENHMNYGNLDDVRAALTTLGLSVQDVFKVMSACTLLNNLVFKEMRGTMDVENLNDLEDASILLGISALSLYRTLMNCSFEDKVNTPDCQSIRDELVSALYCRVVALILHKANAMLDSFPEVTEDDSTFNDSGIGSMSESSIIHIVDAAGYSKSSVNSLAELLTNVINDQLLGTAQDSTSHLLQNIELSNKLYDKNTIKKRKQITVKHANGKLEVEYELERMSIRNRNSVSQNLICLFDSRSCSFQFVAKLFAPDIEELRSQSSYEPRSTMLEREGASLIQSVLECTKDLQNILATVHLQQIICIKSNERLEFAQLQEKLVAEQIQLFRRSNKTSFMNTLNPITSPTLILPSKGSLAIPPKRSYEVRDGRKYYFPQRRHMIVDYKDKSTGLTFRAGEIIKAVAFAGECFAVENGKKIPAIVPISFTEKSLPPSDGYTV